MGRWDKINERRKDMLVKLLSIWFSFWNKVVWFFSDKKRRIISISLISALVCTGAGVGVGAIVKNKKEKADMKARGYCEMELSDNKSYYIVSGVEDDDCTEIIIPSEYKGKPVKEIGDFAFYQCVSLTSIEIPDSVTSIRDGAFYRCYSLTNIDIPDSVTSIGGGALYDCSYLTEITLPFVGATKDGTSNTHFGYIFGADIYYSNDDYVPASLKKVTVTGGSIGDNAFRNCSNLTSVVIGDGVTSIGDCAFWDCSSLTSVEISDSVTSIGSFAFADCSSLTSIDIPDSVTRIWDRAFASCYSLTSIVIPDSVTSIGDYAFYGCSSLTSITFEDTSTWYKVDNYADWENKTGGTEMDVTDSATNVTYFTSEYAGYYYYWFKL